MMNMKLIMGLLMAIAFGHLARCRFIKTNHAFAGENEAAMMAGQFESPFYKNLQISFGKNGNSRNDAAEMFFLFTVDFNDTEEPENMPYIDNRMSETKFGLPEYREPANFISEMLAKFQNGEIMTGIQDSNTNRNLLNNYLASYNSPFSFTDSRNIYKKDLSSQNQLNSNFEYETVDCKGDSKAFETDKYFMNILMPFSQDIDLRNERQSNVESETENYHGDLGNADIYHDMKIRRRLFGEISGNDQASAYDPNFYGRINVEGMNVDMKRVEEIFTPVLKEFSEIATDLAGSLVDPRLYNSNAGLHIFEERTGNLIMKLQQAAISFSNYLRETMADGTVDRNLKVRSKRNSAYDTGTMQNRMLNDSINYITVKIPVPNVVVTTSELNFNRNTIQKNSVTGKKDELELESQISQTTAPQDSTKKGRRALSDFIAKRILGDRMEERSGQATPPRSLKKASDAIRGAMKRLRPRWQNILKPENSLFGRKR